MAQFKTKCVYCGEPGTTAEHLWGRWSIKLAKGTAERNEHFVTRYVDPANRLGPVTRKGALHRPGKPRSQSLKIACQTCNNGWMSRLLEAAIPILEQFSEGCWVDLTTSERTALSAWIVLFSMSHEFADRETVCVSPEERLNFSKSSVPSSNWQIAIGHRTYAADDPVFHRAMLVAPEIAYTGNPHSQFTVFAFGHLIVVAYYKAFEFGFYFPRPFPHSFAAMGLTPLWPLTTVPLTRPPIDYELESLAALVDLTTVAIERGHLRLPQSAGR